MRDIKVDISTFSKASKTRPPTIFQELFQKLQHQESLAQGQQSRDWILFPLDSTIVTLTSKLLWHQGYNQVKLFAGINTEENEPDGILVHFGQGHDSKHGEETIAATPKKGVAVMDRGFCKLERIRRLQEREERYFVLRIKNNMKLEMLEEGQYLVGTGKEKTKMRLVNFSDVEKQTEFRLATNLPESGEGGVSSEEIGEIYKKRWQIELLWKFLKMHLKLDRLITKNVNGITIQIYTSLIAYLLLKKVEIPKEFGSKMLSKLRYLQAFMSEKISYVHWFRELMLRC